jgi:hypothetical protein
MDDCVARAAKEDVVSWYRLCEIRHNYVSFDRGGKKEDAPTGRPLYSSNQLPSLRPGRAS